jgi:GT2 family glycosyltransferase
MAAFFGNERRNLTVRQVAFRGVQTLTAIVPATDLPATLEACLEAIREADEGPDEIVVVEESERPGPAAARNEGARRATGDVLVFVDADVVVHRDAFGRIRRAFEDESLVAVFGSYDDAPAAEGVVSGFRNLLHHHVHQEGAGPAETFWAGLGAIRRDALLAAGGFDEHRYARPSIEDVELGLRLSSAGHRIRLDPELQGTHLKSWTLRQMVATDVLHRGAPWVDLMLDRRLPSSTLNLGWRHRLSAVAAVGLVAAVAGRRHRTGALLLLALVGLNVSFYELLLRKRGPEEAALGVGLHVVHHLSAATAVPLGVVKHLRERR